MGHNRSYKPEDIRFPDQVITESNLVDEMEKSYIEYAMSVIVGRALPDVRDGLKPVHRRILYTMYESGLTSDKPFKKSATCVGDVLGKYHPHGDASVYDAMVRLAQDFSMRYMLVDGHGNFGSVDGDPPAAYRYTEARMSKIANEMLRDIDKETVDWDPNFDESRKEPRVLPARFPNLLVNGSSGIAVGMATNIPPHNLGEVIDGVVKMIENPDVTTQELMECIKGPDFPTGGIILGRKGIYDTYATGRGRIITRAKTEVEPMQNGRQRIVVTEIPYMVNKARLIEKIAELVREKRVEGISDIRDESDRQGMRIVIELKKDVNAAVVLNYLYKHTQLQDTFGAIMLALVDGEPRVLSLRDMLFYYLEHRKDVVTRRTRYDLEKAKERLHILEGLLIALDRIDEVISLIRASATPPIAREGLMTTFGLTEKQAQAILDMRLQRLTGLERDRLEEEYAELEKTIQHLKDVLASELLVRGIIRDELTEIKRKYSDERRTEIQSVTGEVDIEDLIAEEQCVYTLTEAGYIKRQLKATYQAQRRGGRGISGMTRKEEDIVQEMFVGSTHDYVLFVTDRGRLFRIKGYTIAEGSRTSKGMNIVNLLQLAEGEKVTNMICQSKDAEQSGGYVTMVTKQGLIKRTPLEQYANIRKSGLIGIALNEGDALAWTRLTSGHDMLIVATRNGQAIRFNEENARPMGRNGHGVRAIRLAEGDEVVGVCICREGGTVLTVTENGKGRRSDIDTYRITARGGKGIRNYDVSRDKVAAVKIVDDVDDVLLSSQEGIIIRLHANEIPLQSRYGSGVRVMRLGENDKVMVLARTDHDDEAQTEKIDASEADAEPTAEQLAEMEAADAAAATEAPEADPEEKE